MSRFRNWIRSFTLKPGYVSWQLWPHCPSPTAIAFPGLRDLLDMSAGNLSVHLRKLEDAAYIDVTKTHRGRTPVTYIALTTRGRLAFEQYTTAIRALIDPSGGSL